MDVSEQSRADRRADFEMEHEGVGNEYNTVPTTQVNHEPFDNIYMVDTKPENDGYVALHLEKEVELFVCELHDQIHSRNIPEIRRLYENEFASITDRYYREAVRWPSPQEVMRYLEGMRKNHPTILALYTELYYRHAFSKAPNTIVWQDRVSSWNNYRLLLNYFISEECERDASTTVPGLCLPSSWLWDLLDQFVNVFISTCEFRGKVGRILKEGTYPGSKEELAIMLNGSSVWTGRGVLYYLKCLLHRSSVRQHMANNPDMFIFKSDGSSPEIDIKYQLGYFAAICLLRLYNFLGFCYLGIKAIDGIEQGEESFYRKVSGCGFTLYYNLAFSLCCLGSFVESVKTCQDILLSYNKDPNSLNINSIQGGSTTKFLDRIFAILIAGNYLLGYIGIKSVDESLTLMIQEKYFAISQKLQEDHEDAFNEIFLKFFGETGWPWVPREGLADFIYAYHNSDATQIRLRQSFLRHVRRIRSAGRTMSFIKLYNYIKMEKLGYLMGTGADVSGAHHVIPEVLSLCNKKAVLSLKDKELNSPLPTLGEQQECIPELSINLDIVHIKTNTTEPVFTDYFLSQISRCNNLLKLIQS